MKLSIAMIVKNEEKYIENTLIPLKKLQNYFDSEIVIVDTGSTDNTVNIAMKYADRIYHHEWNNNFSEMRNLSINYCSGEWILIVDADEVLYDVEELVRLLENKKNAKYKSGLLKIVNFVDDVDSTIAKGYVSPLLRLFKRGSVKYEGIVHEQPIYNNPVIDTNIRFIHYGYNNNNYQLMEYKFKRNSSLLLKQLEEEPENVYVNFQLASTYIMHNDLQEGLKYIKIAYSKARNNIGKYIYVIDKYCFLLYKLKEYKLLSEKVEEGIKYCNNFIDFYFYSGEAYFNLNDYDKAINSFNKYLHCDEKLNKNLVIPNNTLSILTRGYKNNVQYSLALCYYKKNLYEKALDVIKIIDDNVMLKEKIFVILKIIIDGKLWDEVNLLNRFIDKYNYENILNYLNGEVLIDDLLTLHNSLSEGIIKDTVSMVLYYKENRTLNQELAYKMKKIIEENRMPYSTYIYYLLKYDINEIKNIMVFGKNKVENILKSLCIRFFDFNMCLLESLEKINTMEFYDVAARTSIRKVLLLSGKLPKEKKKDMFLSFVAEKYICIVKSYKKELVEENSWVLLEEERFIIKLKNSLNYKFEDTLKYIKSLKDILSLEKSYIDFIKLIIEDDEDKTINKDIKDFIPELVKNIITLINSERYQEAYDAIEEALSIGKFDYDLMTLKYHLLMKFKYEEEAKNCLRDIILFGDSEKVKDIINNM